MITAYLHSLIKIFLSRINSKRKNKYIEVEQQPEVELETNTSKSHRKAEAGIEKAFRIFGDYED